MRDIYKADFCKCFTCIVDKDRIVHVMKLNTIYRKIKFCISITPNFRVTAFRRNTAVAIRDLLGMQWKLEKWSQLRAILDRVMNYQLSSKTEIKASVKELQSKLEISDDNSSCYDFLLEQLVLKVTEEHGRHYSAKTMLIATELFLNSRSAYRKLSNNLAIPTQNTTMKNLGSFATMGSAEQVRRISSTVFASKDSRIKCILLFDEVYVKPSIRYRSGHVVGYSIDKPDEAARTVLAFMVKLLFEKRTCSTYVVRLIPIHTLTS